MRFAYLSLSLGNTYNELLARHVEEGFRDAGHSLLIVEGSRLYEGPEKLRPQAALFSRIPLEGLDGIVVSSLFGFVGPAAAASFMSPFRGMKALVLSDAVEGFPSVAVDDAPGFRALVSRLADGLGCRRFAAITGPANHRDSIRRMAILQECLAERGLPLDPSLVWRGTYDFFDGEAGVKGLLGPGRPPFDALVCFNDNMALGALRELRARGICVPEDVKVTGFDDILEAAHAAPPLSTVSCPLDELGRTAADTMLALVRGERVPDRIAIPSRFVERASTSSTPSAGGEAGGIPDEWLYSRKASEALAEAGEDLGTAFDPERIVRKLRKHLERLDLSGCALALYEDPGMGRVRWLMGPEGLEGRVAEARLPFPDSFPSGWGSVVACCLHIREQQLGFIVFPFRRASGLVYRTLASHVSIAFTGANLVRTIDGHSRELEAKVNERTAELKAANDRLLAEAEARTRLEGIILRQKNYESLGLLAGGLAHDFNNYLAGILGNAALLEGEQGEAERASCLADLVAMAKRATALTRQLLTFARGGGPVKQALALAPLAEEMARFLISGTAVALRFEAEEGLPQTEADPDQVSQVLHNIILNAVQAMPRGGDLAIRLRSERREGSEGRLAPGEYVRMDISDSGCGMEREVMERIFDPYYSTKAEGTGLGLSVSLSVAQRHGGDIRVSSEPGRGSTFSVFLPALGKRAEAGGGTEMAAGKAGGAEEGGRRILILEDEEIVGRALERTLVRLGHRAAQTRDGAETVRAYAAARDSGEPFDLVIADLTIPGGMGGLDALEGLRRIDPDVKAVVVSGYSDAGVMSDPRSFGFVAGLRKPYGLDDLKAVLSEALKARGS